MRVRCSYLSLLHKAFGRSLTLCMRAAAERVGWLQASAETGEAVNQAFWIALLHPIPTFMLPVKSASSTDSTINQFNHERL